MLMVRTAFVETELVRVTGSLFVVPLESSDPERWPIPGGSFQPKRHREGV